MAIGASLTTLNNGTDNIDATPVNANFAALNAAGLGGSLASQTLTGSTAGSANLYQLTIGIFKCLLIEFVGYRNSTGTEQTFTLADAFTSGALWIGGDTKLIRPYNSGSALSSKVEVISTISNGSSGGSTTTGNTTQPNANGNIIAAFDAIGLGTGQASTVSGFAFIIGK